MQLFIDFITVISPVSYDSLNPSANKAARWRFLNELNFVLIYFMCGNGNRKIISKTASRKDKTIYIYSAISPMISTSP
jgi:hypothetical protein